MSLDESSALLVFIDIIIYFIIYFNFKNSKCFPYRIKKNKTFGLFLLLLFCLFSFWGSDWFHYYELFPEIKAGSDTHLENVYYLIGRISPNYIIFRLIIWGTGLILYAKTISRLEVSNDLCWFVFASSYLIWFSYSRVSLAMAIAFCGFAFIVGKNRAFQTLLLGVGLILVSFFFHKSSSFAIVCILITLIAQRIPKLTYALLIIMFPLLVLYVNSSLSEFMMMSFDTDSGDINAYMMSGQRYFNGNQNNAVGMGEMFRNLLERIPYYCTSAFSIFALYKSKIAIPSSIKPFMVLQVIIVMLSSVLLFSPTALTTGTIYIRFLRFAFIPTSIVLAYLYQSGYANKFIRIIIFLANIGAIYALTYSFYCRL